MSRAGTNQNPIDVDIGEWTQEVEAVAQGKRHHRALFVPAASSGAAKRKRATMRKDIIDLTLDDSDEMVNTTLRPRPSNNLPLPSSGRSSRNMAKKTVPARFLQSIALPVNLPKRSVQSAPKASTSQPTKLSSAISKARNTLEVESSSQEDWDAIHSALEISNEANWNIPITHRPLTHTLNSTAEREYERALRDSNEHSQAYLRRQMYSGTRSVSIHPASVVQVRLSGRSFWDTVANINLKSKHGRTRSPHRHDARLLDQVHRWSGLQEHSYPGLMPGAINSISQSGDLVAITSCTSDGLATTDSRSVAYNRSGTLVMLRQDHVISFDGHHAMRDVQERVNRHLDEVKYYSVSEAIFVPGGKNHLVSCGEDSKIIMWDCTPIETGGPPRQVSYYPYHKRWVPRGMSINPDATMGQGARLAVTSSEGEISIHNIGDLQDFQMLTVTPPEHTRSIQEAAWGRGPSAGRIYATSGLDEYDDHDPGSFSGGYHKGFDINTGREIFSASHERAGEALAVNSAGNMLALATSLYEGESLGFNFEVALYDIANNDSNPIWHIPLTGWPRFVVPEGDLPLAQPRVNSVSFSPDSVYLAAARSDNRVQLFDTRWLDRVLCDFKHQDAPEGTGVDGQYGVYKVDWLEDPQRGLQLISGGSDGCVRLWDVRRGTDRVIAQADYYVSWFNVGDVSLGEKALIVGDGGGTVITKG